MIYLFLYLFCSQQPRYADRIYNTAVSTLGFGSPPEKPNFWMDTIYYIPWATSSTGRGHKIDEFERNNPITIERITFPIDPGAIVQSETMLLIKMIENYIAELLAREPNIFFYVFDEKTHCHRPITIKEFPDLFQKERKRLETDYLREHLFLIEYLLRPIKAYNNSSNPYQFDCHAESDRHGITFTDLRTPDGGSFFCKFAYAYPNADTYAKAIANFLKEKSAKFGTVKILTKATVQKPRTYHAVFFSLQFDPSTKQLKVRIYDPDCDAPDGKDPFLLNRILDWWNKREPNSVVPKIPEIRSSFECIATALGVSLDFQYIFTGHQVYNEHDCVIFSKVYEFYAARGRSPESLTPYEIYLGFRRMETLRVDQNPQRSWFAGFMHWTIKKPLCAFLDWRYPFDFKNLTKRGSSFG